MEDGRLLQAAARHQDLVTCIAATPCGRFLVSGRGWLLRLHLRCRWISATNPRLGSALDTGHDDDACGHCQNAAGFAGHGECHFLLDSAVQHRSHSSLLNGARCRPTGSRDTTVIVWDVGGGGAGDPGSGGRRGRAAAAAAAAYSGNAPPLGCAPRHVLAGHGDAVTCLAADAGLDTLVSGGADGVLLFHMLRTGR